MKPKFLSTGYYWVPADLASFQPFYVGVRYGNYRVVGKKVLKRRENFNVYLYQFPDRQLILCKKLLSEMRALDEVLHVDPLSGFFKDFMPLAMTNALTTSDLSRRAYGASKHLKVIQDSGGFQLFSGRSQFIDPVDVAKKHEDVQIGIGLDIPSYAIDSWDLMERTARVLSENNQVMRKHTKTFLLNVCHGHTVEQRRRYLDISMEKEPLDGLAISSVKNSFVKTLDPKSFAQHIIASILHTKKQYSYFHVLGVATRWQMAFLAVLAQRLGVVITSDSTTWAMYAANGNMHDYRSAENAIGRRTAPFTLARNPCGCKVCAALRYLAVYRDRTVVLQAHNIESIAYQGSAYNHFAKCSDFNWVANEIPTTTDPKKSKAILDAFKLLDNIKMPSSKDVQKESKALFTLKSRSRVATRYENIVRRYEKYYGKEF